MGNGVLARAFDLRVVLLGPPGCGKGTYGGRMAQEYDLRHISAGKLVRNAIQQGSSLGALAEKYFLRGQLVPDPILWDIISPTISEAASKGGFILDGYPRSIAQAQRLAQLCSIDRALHITMRLDALRAKLLGRRSCPTCGKDYNIAAVEEDGGRFLMPAMLPTDQACVANKCADRFESRKDDTPEAVEERLNVYQCQNDALTGFYRAKDVVADIEIQGGETVMLPIFRAAMRLDYQQEQAVRS